MPQPTQSKGSQIAVVVLNVVARAQANAQVTGCLVVQVVHIAIWARAVPEPRRLGAPTAWR